MSEQSERKDRAMVIAAKCKLTQNGNVWHVPSQSGFKSFYCVDPVAKTCDCPDYEKREAPCKHIYAVEIVIERETSTTTTTTTDADGNTTANNQKGRITRPFPYL